jgi:hypothetical protein
MLCNVCHTNIKKICSNASEKVVTYMVESITDN